LGVAAGNAIVNDSFSLPLPEVLVPDAIIIGVSLITSYKTSKDSVCDSGVDSNNDFPTNNINPCLLPVLVDSLVTDGDMTHSGDGNSSSAGDDLNNVVHNEVLLRATPLSERIERPPGMILMHTTRKNLHNSLARISLETANQESVCCGLFCSVLI